MIGPTYLPQVQGPLVAHQWGFNLGMEWPLWNFNGGGKRQKRWEWERAVHHLKSETHRLADEARHAETLYRREVELFKSLPLASFLEKQHQSQEAQYERGVIPSSLIIEAHRQLVDFTLQKHQAELRLWNAYWTVHRSRGNSIDILWNDLRKEVL
jgi:cobalt-zinc-cadmium efflux system outer membrane protein